MSRLTYTCTPGTHLSPGQLAEAADLLSWAYTRWQNNPKNTNPLKTDTSPEVYSRLLRGSDREVVLGRIDGTLVAVFVNALNNSRGLSTLRKASFIGVRPLERGFGPLTEIFRGLSKFSAQNGEDVICTTDLDQATLNSLFEDAGFREITDRNETYFILSHMLERKLIASHRIQGDFVIDEIITVDGEALRRDKKLYKLQTTPVSPYEQYRSELNKRLCRCIPQANRELLAEAFQGEATTFFLNGYYDSLIWRDQKRGGFDTGVRIFGSWESRDMAGQVDEDQSLVWLKPSDLEAMRAIAERAVFRAGLFDFMTYTLSLLCSSFVVTGAPKPEVETVLARTLHTEVPLRLRDMVEAVFAPHVERVAGARTILSGRERTGYRFREPYATIKDGRLVIRKRRMVEDVLARRTDPGTPIVYLGGHEDEVTGVARLYEEARDAGASVLVFDFGTALTQAVVETCMAGGPEACPRFSIVGAQDFYQIPVMLELLGLSPDTGLGLDLAD